MPASGNSQIGWRALHPGSPVLPSCGLFRHVYSDSCLQVSPRILDSVALPLGPCFIHPQISPHEILFVQFLDCLQSFFSNRHFHKAESSGSSRDSIHYDLGSIDCSVAFEEIPEILINCFERDVTYVNVDSFHVQTPFSIGSPAQRLRAARRFFGSLGICTSVVRRRVGLVPGFFILRSSLTS